MTKRKKQIGSIWDFPRPATVFGSRYINRYFKINVAFFCRSLFSIFGSGSKNYKNDCINSQLNPFMNLKDTLGLEAFNPLGL